VPVTEARAAFSELINRVGYGGERIILTRHGKPLVALVPASEADDQPHQEADEDITVLDMASTTTRHQSSPGIAARHPADPQARD
jgi:prevent-host-death family protein